MVQLRGSVLLPQIASEERVTEQAEIGIAEHAEMACWDLEEWEHLEDAGITKPSQLFTRNKIKGGN